MHDNFARLIETNLKTDKMIKNCDGFNSFNTVPVPVSESLSENHLEKRTKSTFTKIGKWFFVVSKQNKRKQNCDDKITYRKNHTLGRKQ